MRKTLAALIMITIPFLLGGPVVGPFSIGEETCGDLSLSTESGWTLDGCESISPATPTPTPTPTPEPTPVVNCRYSMNSQEYSEVPATDRPLFRIWSTKHLYFQKDESRTFCFDTPENLPGSELVSLDFQASESHNHIGCAGLQVKATAPSGAVYYLKEEDGTGFPRHGKVRLRSDRFEAGRWVLELQDRSVLGDHNKNGVVEPFMRVYGGDQCTVFVLKALMALRW